MATFQQSGVTAALGRVAAPMLALFTATIFCAAILVFSVQPMVAKMVLPSFGGSPAVWNTALVFFQAALLAGYGYAHLVARLRRLRHQIEIHVVMLALAAAVLPIAVASGWVIPGGEAPAWRLLGLLTASVGLPFVAVSATSPLVQHWFARSGHPHAADPYFLYAASNLGSILALLGYPLLVEPVLSVGAQSQMWTALYVMTGGLILGCGLLAARRDALGRVGEVAREQPADVEVAPSLRRRGRWIACGAVPSALLIGVTNHITTDLAAAPMLWVVPLALYLLTFVIVFARRPVVSHQLAVRVFPYAMVVLAGSFTAVEPASMLLPLHLVVFFCAALMAHGELAACRPGPSRLTEFYLHLSLGGVLGGVCAALVAPAVFDAVHEYPIALAAACLLLPRGSRRSGLTPRTGDVALACGVVAVILGGKEVLAAVGFAYGALFARAAIAVGAVVAFSRKDRPIGFALCIGAVLIGAIFAVHQSDTLVRARSFFGAYRVAEANSFRLLMHGTTIHGAQHLEAKRRDEPSTYYAKDGPIAEIIGRIQAENPAPTIGVVGLGAGSLACYRRPADTWRYYEIDPLVVRLASDPRYFTFLQDCAGQTPIVVGDARLTLAGEPDGLFSLLVIDAFTSDSIPVHLLTSEALSLYVDKLTPGGIVVVHISNRHLDLEPVLARGAAVLGLVGRSGRKIETSADRISSSASIWIALARDDSVFQRLGVDPRWKALPAADGGRPWTDAYSDVIGAIRW